jgi:hypothetical protein
MIQVRPYTCNNCRVKGFKFGKNNYSDVMKFKAIVSMGFTLMNESDCNKTVHWSCKTNCLQGVYKRFLHLIYTFNEICRRNA